MMKLGSEGVYLHEKCGTNPSRYLPGLKTPLENKKRRFLGLIGIFIKDSGSPRSALTMHDHDPKLETLPKVTIHDWV